MQKIFKKVILSLLIMILLGLLPNISKGDAQSIKLSFCENLGKPPQEKKLLMIQPGEQKEVCLNFLSRSALEEEITYGFMEALMPGEGSQLCKLEQSIGSENPFAKLFTNDNGNQRTFILKPGEDKTINEKVNIPIGMDGMIYGCIAYKTKPIVSEGTSNKQMFTIVSQVNTYLNLFIGGTAEINNSIKLLKANGNKRSSNKKIGIISKGDKFLINFLIKNDGNVGQNVSIKGTIYNSLGFEKTFEIPTTMISPGNETKIESEQLLLPTYKGFFNVSSTITSEPKFEFNANSIDENIKKSTTIEEFSKIFIFSRIWIIVGLVALLVVIMVLRPLFKKHKI